MESSKPPKKETIRITIDIPEPLYVEMKTKVVKDRSTIKEYFLDLLKNDLKADLIPPHDE